MSSRLLAVLGLALAAFTALAPSPLRAQDEPDPRELPAKAPAALRENYLLAEDSTSPDGRYAVIFPKRAFHEDPSAKDQIIELATFTPIGALRTKDPYFEGRNHGGISAAWSADSANVLVTLDSKWGPDEIHLLELRDGRVARDSRLLATAREILLPDFRRARVSAVNDIYAFFLEDPNTGGNPEVVAKFDGPRTVRVRILGNTNPKGIPGLRYWRALFTGEWDIAQARYVKHTITRRAVGVSRGK